MPRNSRKLIEIDVAALKQALREAGCESLEEASVTLFGHDRTYLTNLIRRKRCTVETLDTISVKLERHMSELSSSELFVEEDWPDDLDD